MNRGAAAAVVVALAAVVTSCAASGGEDGGGGGQAAASCAALMDFRGVRYAGYGGTTRTPVAGKRLGTGTLPPCNDTGENGRNGPTEPATPVTVRAIAGVDPGTAVLTGGDQLWVRRSMVDAGRPSAVDLIRTARRPVPCTLPAPTTITGTWTGMTSPHPARADGDVRTPFTVELRTGDRAVVPTGWAAVQLRARAADGAPAPSKEQVRQLLWHDHPSAFGLHCDGDRFVLDHLSGVQR
ncbi:MAG TPA: DUF6281 family protein [Segeticoccus sp.]|jgi:hypothetical protein|nr:DUF6281 family protein [Segeticoccus sp.]